MRIIFMGTPDFAVPSLAILHQSRHEVVGVVTAPDRPAGRGRKLRPSPVKAYAEAQGLPVLQPVKLRDPAFIDQLRAWQPDLMVVVAFRMLPEVVWSIPARGTFNLHASLLPNYRGAAPINWVIVNGETRTGLTTFLIDKQIDTGNLLLQAPVDILPHWTAGDLHDHMMDKGAQLVLQTADGLAQEALTPQPQDDRAFQQAAPKLFKEDCQLDWSQPAEAVHNRIRGFSPYPGAWTTLEGDLLKVFRSELSGEATEAAPGQVQTTKDELRVACGDQWLRLLELQQAGKKRLPVHDFLRGFKEPLAKLGQ